MKNVWNAYNRQSTLPENITPGVSCLWNVLTETGSFGTLSCYKVNWVKGITISQVVMLFVFFLLSNKSPLTSLHISVTFLTANIKRIWHNLLWFCCMQKDDVIYVDWIDEQHRWNLKLSFGSTSDILHRRSVVFDCAIIWVWFSFIISVPRPVHFEKHADDWQIGVYLKVWVNLSGKKIKPLWGQEWAK